MPRRRTVDDWRRAVYRSTTINDATRVYLLLLADEMRVNRNVTLPRAQVAQRLGKSERQIQRRVQAAHEAGLLGTIQHGRKGITATYVGLFPDVSETSPNALKSSEADPLNRGQEVRNEPERCPTYYWSERQVAPVAPDGAEEGQIVGGRRRGHLALVPSR